MQAPLTWLLVLGPRPPGPLLSLAVLLGALLLAPACGAAPPAAPRALPDPQSDSAHAAWETQARARVEDGARGGPPLVAGASPLPPFLGVSRATAAYVGAGACGGCHPDALRTWTDSAHAHSRATLEEAGRAFDPSCLRCHTTGLGHPGGFGEQDLAELAVVGCEACHGPGSEHIAGPAPGYGQLPQGGAACVACHTHDNSPDFTWEAFWPRVAH